MNYLKRSYNWGKSFFRSFNGNCKLKEYLSIDNNEAVTQLVNEGYNFFIEFNRLIDEYTSVFYLTFEESVFINQIKASFHAKYVPSSTRMLEIDIIKMNFSHIKFGITNINLSLKNDDMQFLSELQKVQIKNLENNITKILPVYEAVTTRRCIKVVLEKLIIDNIKTIYLENYVPSRTIIENYIKSLKRSSWRIDDEMSKFIISVEKHFENVKENDKDKSYKAPRISSTDRIIDRDIHGLGTMKKETSKIIHFNDPKDINFDLDENFGNIDTEEEAQNKTENKNNSNENNNEEEHSYTLNNINEHDIDSSLVIKYIFHGNTYNNMSKKLKELHSTYNENKENLEKDIKFISEYEIQNMQDILDKMNRTTTSISQHLKTLSIPDLDFPFDVEGLTNVINYVNNNKFDLQSIPTDNHNFTPQEIEFCKQLNNILKNMNSYQRLKFNVTFEFNLYLIDLKYQMEKLDKQFRIFQRFKERKENLIKDSLNKLKIIDNKIKEINKMINIVNNIKIIRKKKSEDIESDLLTRFKSGSLNISQEINNFYFFVYLLINNLYKEKEYKSAKGLIDDNL